MFCRTMPAALLSSPLFSVSSVKSLCIDSSLNRPPGQRLAHPLGHKQPVVGHFSRWLAIGLSSEAAVEVVAVNVDLVVGINLRRRDFCFLLVRTQPCPATRSVPVLANFFAILKADLHVHRHHETFIPFQPDVRSIHY